MRQTAGHRRQKARILVAWMLFGVLMPLFVVKATHFHDTPSCCEHEGHSDEDAAPAHHCDICFFTLSAFTEADTIEFHCQISVSSVERPVREEEGVAGNCFSVFLRAPPRARTEHPSPSFFLV